MKEGVIYGARVAELADALDLGSSPLLRMGVQVPPLAVPLSLFPLQCLTNADQEPIVLLESHLALV